MTQRLKDSKISIGKAAFRLEWILHWRQQKIFLNAFILYVMILIFFPLSLPFDPPLLRQIFPGLLWLAILFSFFLSMDHWFASEYEEGLLEQWILRPKKLRAMIYCKLLFHWLFHLVPLVVSSVMVMPLFSIQGKEWLILVLSLMVGTPIILLCGALAASFTLGMRQKGMFVALLVLPLSLPVIILGSGVVSHAMQQLPISGELALLLAMNLLGILGIPRLIECVLKLQD